MNKKKVLLIVIGVLLIISVSIGLTYAYYMATITQNGENVVKTDCFEISLVDDGQVVLSDAFPVRDSDANTITPYHFKIKNICSVPMAYQVNLEILNTSDLDINYLNYKLNNNSIIALNSATAVEKTLANATSAKELVTGDLLANEEVEYDLRVFLKESVTTSDPVQNKSFKSKIVVISTQNVNAVNTIRKLVANADKTSIDAIGDTGLAYDGTEDNNLRYVGANPNNYVQFNNELWRIIGVMNNIENESGQVQSLVKIRRVESLGNYSWDTSASGVNNGYGVNEWSQADLMRELNYDYLGDVQVGTDGKWYSGRFNAKSNTMPTSTISSEEQNQIESVKWNLGSPSNNAGSYDSNWTSVTSSTAYIRERSNYTGKVCTSGTYCNDTVTRTSSWTGKIGLFYPSDYLYATSGGNATNRQTCLGLGMYTDWSNSSYANCKDNDWLKPASGYTWSLSPYAYSSHAVYVFGVSSTGGFGGNGANGAYGVRPVVFLKSSVKILSGTGISTDPYILG